MISKKLILFLFLILLISSISHCYCQPDNNDITGSWIAVKGDIVSHLCNGSIESKEIKVNGLRFFFDAKTLKINKIFGQLYSPDSTYKYAFKDTIPRGHLPWYNIKILFYDQNNLIMEMKYLDYCKADRVMWYEIHLKRE